MIAELQILCPWAMPTTSGVAPSLHWVLLNTRTRADAGILRHQQPGVIEFWQSDALAATIRVVITMPDDPATEPIGVKWHAERPGQLTVACATWDEAYVEATR